MKNGNEVVRTLRSSCNKVGKLYPVIEDFQGNIIDGRHRLEADKKC